MFYRAEFEFFQACLEKCHVPVSIISEDRIWKNTPDLGLRHLLGTEDGICAPGQEIRDFCIYRLQDAFLCNYLFLKLPDANGIMLMGPFLSENFSAGAALEIIKKHAATPDAAKEMENYYGTVSPLPAGSQAFHMLEVFCEVIWKGRQFKFIELDAPETELGLDFGYESDSEGPLWKMEQMEKRYRYENEMMEAVSKGQIHKAKMILPIFSAFSFERRLSDPLRNLKNYCIIMNTLLRKAAENGGVHPVFLDRISSRYAREIENVPSVAAAQGLMVEMFDRYCRLVRKHSLVQYSPQVQKAIVTIESNHAMDLSLSNLAGMQGISAGYLSRLFKKEMGQNITEYVNHRRIEHAVSLLTGTKMQIQTVAQHCGIMDVQYFSRLFKKIKGMTPNEYRRVYAENG